MTLAFQATSHGETCNCRVTPIKKAKSQIADILTKTDTRNCPTQLMQEIQDNKYYFENKCSFTRNTSPNDLEKMFAKDPTYSYVDSDFLTGGRCLQYLGKYSDSDKSWLVANYYNYTNSLRACETSVLQGIASVDKLMRDQNFAKTSGCKNAINPKINNWCKALEGCPTASFPQMVQETEVAEAEIRQIREDQLTLEKGPYRRDGDKFVHVSQLERQQLIKSADDRITALKATYPWMQSDLFEGDDLPQNKIEQTLKTLYNRTRSDLHTKLNAIREAEACLDRNNCDMSKLKKVLDFCPGLETNALPGKGKNASERAKLSALQSSSSCEDTRNKFSDYSKAKRQFEIDMAFGAVLGFGGLIEGQVVAIAASRLALNGLNLGVQTYASLDACSYDATHRYGAAAPVDSHLVESPSCSNKLNYDPISDYRGCATNVLMAGLTIIPGIKGLLKEKDAQFLLAKLGGKASSGGTTGGAVTTALETSERTAAKEVDEAVVNAAQGARNENKEKIADWAKAHYKINDDAASPGHLAGRPDLMEGPTLYADHGVRHVEDTVENSLSVLKDINAREGIPQARVKFREEYTENVALLHDIGMSNPANRVVHPEVATHAAFTPEFEKNVLAPAWDNGNSDIAKRLIKLKNEGHLDQDPKDVLREMLSMSNAHSKSKVARSALEEAGAHEMRNIMLHAAGTDIEVLRAEANLSKLLKNKSLSDVEKNEVEQLQTFLRNAKRRDTIPNNQARSHYKDFDKEAYAWLDKADADPQIKELWDDVRTSLKALSIGDVIRQRGVALRTSGGHQIILDRFTGQAIVAIADNGQVVHLASNNIIHLGESNIAGAFVKDGDLHIAIQTGSFPLAEVHRKLTKATSTLVQDIADDGMILGKNQKLVIEAPVDNPEFAKEVRERLIQNPKYRTIQDRIEIRQPDAQTVAAYNAKLKQLAVEDQRYQMATATYQSFTHNDREKFINAFEASDGKSRADLELGLSHAKVVELQPGQTLMNAGDHGKYAYIVVDDGLVGKAAGGYGTFEPKPGQVIGEGGLLRGGERNATIAAKADGGPVKVLMVPQDDYIKYILNKMDAPTAAKALQEGRSGRFVPINQVKAEMAAGYKPVVLDTSVGPPDALTIDHHADYYKPGLPRLNTTKQELNDMEKTMAGQGSTKEKLERISQKYAVVSTDNLGDGGWSVYIAKHPKEIVTNPQLMKTIRVATDYEDFGLFEDDFQKFLNQKPDVYRPGQELQQSILNQYDKILKEAHLPSDRISNLPAAQQAEIMKKVDQAIGKSLHDPDFRKANAIEFEKNMQLASKEVESSHEEIGNKLAGSLNGSMAKFEKNVYIYDSGKINPDHGVFATWGSPPKSKLLLNVRELPNGRTMVILSAPGRGQMPIKSLKMVGEKINQADLAYVKEQVEAGGRLHGASEEQIAKDVALAIDKEKKAQVTGRDRLQFSFEGLKMPISKIAEVISDSLP